MTEEWRAVEDWPGYEVSDIGRVRSWKRASGLTEPQVLALGLSAGYPCISLSAPGRHGTLKVHWLVAAAFLGPRPEGQEIAHNDGDRLNCRASNLRYATQAENAADKRQHGTLLLGEQVSSARLTDDQVRSIYADARPNSVVAAEYGVGRQAIGKIKRGRRWSWLTSAEPKPLPTVRLIKLSRDDVREIRASYVKGLNRWQRGNAAELAQRFGISINHLTVVATDPRWGAFDVDGEPTP